MARQLAREARFEASIPRRRADPAFHPALGPAGPALARAGILFAALLQDCLTCHRVIPAGNHGAGLVYEHNGSVGNRAGPVTKG